MITEHERMQILLTRDALAFQREVKELERDFDALTRLELKLQTFKARVNRDRS